MRAILFIIGIILSADGLFCAYTGSMGLGEEIIIAVGVILILWSALYDAFKSKKPLRVIRNIFVICFVVLIAYSTAICIVGYQDNSIMNENYVIVPGAGLQDGQPSALLKSRLDKTIEYTNTNANASIIVSGGQGADESMTEGLAMYNYLMENGVSESRIYVEDQASSTYENFALTKEAVSDGTSVIITNEFHILRSSLMAQLNGINSTHIAAPTPWVQLPVACARELIAQVASIRYYIFR